MAEKIAADGAKVKVYYRGTLEDGEEFDSLLTGDPLEFELGAGEVIEGFEEAVRGLHAAETKQVTIPPERAYGERDEEMVLDLPRSSFPEGDLEVGMSVRFALPDGEEADGLVLDAKAEIVRVDFNHPLAGKTLTFEVRVVSVD